MNSTSRSISPSIVSLPEGDGFATVFEFMLQRFPRMEESVWRERIELGKVHFDDGELIRIDTPFQSRRRVFYYREVPHEPTLPFQEEVLFENDDFFIVDKPHFLPVHPAGKYINETLVVRMRNRYGGEEICAAHRIDRSTAGLILCVKHKEKRGVYQQLFMDSVVRKEYLAVGKLPQPVRQTHWHLRERMEQRPGELRMHIVPEGPVNSESIIELVDQHDGLGLFRLQPVTGKKHQLRVHLCHIGCGILNDPLYPTMRPADWPDETEHPMQLLAHRLEFADPVTGEPMKFESKRTLRPFCF